MQPPPTRCILQVSKLGFAYPDQAPLVSDWSLSIGPGVTLLYGDTGSGKSTLIRVLAGLLPATGQLALGEVRLDQLRERYRQNLFFCDATSEAFDQVSGRACTALLSDGDGLFNQPLWQTLIEGFALPLQLDKPMYMLSTGSKRKVWLAAALASGRPLTLLDEPTGGLDAASRQCLWRALADLAAQSKRAIVIASSERVDQIALAHCIDLPLTVQR